MALRLNFTKAAIAALRPPPPGQRLTVHDTKVLGLQLRVTPTGVKTFSVFKRVGGGNPERITLGRSPDMTVEQVRIRATEVIAAIVGGANPAAAKRTRKAELIFAELFAEYLDRHAKPRKRTWKEDEAKYRLYLAKELGTKKLSAINRADIATVHSKVTKQGKPVTANRVLALISSVYGWALSAGVWQNNPAKGIRKNREHSRDRFLQANELPRFFTAVAAETNDVIRDYFLMSLLTGARRANVLAMQWREIDFARSEWRIPRTKNDSPQTVPLMPEAVALLGRRQAETESPYVFPGPGQTGHLVEPKNGWRRIFDRDELSQLLASIQAAKSQFKVAESHSLSESLSRARKVAKRLGLDTSKTRIEGVRIHDLRRTLGSWQARTGASLAIIGKSLNHKSVVTTGIYARLDTDPVRESMSRATAAMFEAAGAKRAGNVVKLPRGIREGKNKNKKVGRVVA